VAGAGGFCGYSKLHHLKAGVTPPAGVTLQASNDELPGFLRITVTTEALTGEYFVVPPPPNHITGPAALADSFTIRL
jgi:hypothetical protein